jgi:hypothetical protein
MIFLPSINENSPKQKAFLPCFTVPWFLFEMIATIK